MAWDDGLQAGTAAHDIAASTHARIRVLAGPGAGKSFAMKRRVARLLEVEKVDPSQILAVTFSDIANRVLGTTNIDIATIAGVSLVLPVTQRRDLNVPMRFSHRVF